MFIRLRMLQGTQFPTRQPPPGVAPHSTKRKAKWDQRVKTALEAQRTANRASHNAVRFLSTEECHEAWQEFLHRKRDMQQRVQRKIAEHN